MRFPTAGKSTFDLPRSLPLNLPSFSMLISMLTGAVFCPALILAQTSPPSQPAAKPLSKPLTLTVYDRTRVEAWQWFAATPNAEQYGYVESLVRLGLQQRVQHVDWQLELSQSTMLGLPSDAVSAVTAQGQLGLGGTYYASNSNNTEPVAASFKQGYLRYHFSRDANTVRLGRFEFFDGQETTPKNTTLAWLQANRIQQRLVGNFGFSNGQRSFDGADAHLTGDSWDLTGMAARADQGVYNMNANPELNVDLQYLAYTRYLASQRVQLRGFAMGYHDGRPNIVKTDNRTVAARTAEVARMVVEDEVHAGLVFHVPADPKIRVKASVDQPIVLLVRPGHPLDRPEPVRLADIAAHRVCMPPEGFRIRQIIAEAEAAEGVWLKTALTANALLLLKELAKSGDCVTLLPRITAAPELIAGTLKAIPIAASALETTSINLITRLGRQLPAAALKLLTMIEASLRKGAGDAALA